MTADDDLTEDEVHAALHFDGRVLALLERSPKEGPVPKGASPKFDPATVKYRPPDLAWAREGLFILQERYRVQLPRADLNSMPMEVGAKLARIAASGWTKRTVR
ncbi:hypothetical protein [Azohydromonas australica]|uniref:hypothetical protein n=1 Tax=Azohydromonas australica TaxID=364039 RepID=UPI000490FF6C|nr:hypothetical protein [Azohydromonas australica]